MARSSSCVPVSCARSAGILGMYDKALAGNPPRDYLPGTVLPSSFKMPESEIHSRFLGHSNITGARELNSVSLYLLLNMHPKYYYVCWWDQRKVA